MLNSSNLIRVAITFAAVTVAAPAFADDASWLDEQRSITDGYSPANTSAGAEGKQGSQAPSPQLDEKLFMSDGYSPVNAAAGPAYVGAKFESNSNDSFMERGRRISDGTPE
ncbi:MAG: hypothetical protein ACREV0_03235 [Burkholderiales bacterium]